MITPNGHEIKAHAGVAIDTARVYSWIDEGIQNLKKSKEPFWYCMSGDTLVVIFRDQGVKHYTVYVSKVTGRASVKFSLEEQFPELQKGDVKIIFGSWDERDGYVNGYNAARKHFIEHLKEDSK